MAVDSFTRRKETRNTIDDGKLTKSFKSILNTNYCMNFEWVKKDLPIPDDFSPSIPSSPIYSCKFGTTANNGNFLALAHENGKLCIEKVDYLGSKRIIESHLHNNAIFEIAWVPHTTNILSASADNSVKLSNFEISSQSHFFKSQTFLGHTKAVKTIDANNWDPNVFASSGRDSAIIVWDVRCQPTKKSNEIQGAHFKQRAIPPSSKSVHRNPHKSTLHNSGIISVKFSSENQIISAGASDGIVKIWDLRKTYSLSKRDPISLHTLQYPRETSLRGYSSMSLSSLNDKLYVSCLDGKIYAYQLICSEPKIVSEFWGHKPFTYYSTCCVSPCGSYLLSGSSDRKAYVWLTDQPGEPIGTLPGLLDEVTCVAWSHANKGIAVTCDDDSMHRIFRVQTTKPESGLDSMSFCRSVRFTKERSGVPLSSDEDNVQEHSSSNSLSRSSPSQSSGNQSHTVANISTTPRQNQPNGSKTPKMSENKTLLAWLSSSKTPTGSRSSLSPSTPELSSAKKKTLKRKLTDVLDEPASNNQENSEDEQNKKPPVSPSQSVLVNVDNNVSVGFSAAKMLRYDTDSSKHQFSSRLPRIDESEESFTIDEDKESNIHGIASFFGNSTTISDESPLKTSSCSSILKAFSSPTANLPNFVIDGKSPHNRLEAPVTPKSRTNWLTSLSQQKSLSRSAEKTPAKSIKSSLKVKKKIIRSESKN